MASAPGTLRFGEIASTPPAPPVGYALFYIKTDNVVYVQDSGGVETALGSASSITELTGDVVAVGPGITAATIISVGGATAADVAAAAAAYTAATAANNPNTLVKRNGSGNFSAGVITADLTGNVTGNVSGTASNVTGIVDVPNGGTNSSTSLVNDRIMISDANKIVEAAAITANRALISDADGIPTHSATTALELSYVSGVTSAIQTQINSITGSSITQLTGDVTAVGPGSVSSTVAAIQGTTVAGTTGTGNVVFSAAPTLTGLLSGDSASFSSTISASNLSGTNTGDITVLDTNSIDLTLVGQQIAADLKLSSDAASASNLKATATIHSGGGAGLHIEYPYATPVQIGTSNAVGAASSFALSDHVHSHGNQTSATLHAAATSIANGFMSSTDKSKLDAATNLNTPSTIVMRDVSGNFSASNITADLTGNISGTSSTFTGNLTGDITSVGMATTIAVGAVTDAKSSLAVKPSVAVVSITNLAVTGLQTIDGVSTVDNTLVLLTAQTSGAQNGPWHVHSGAWTRPTWYPSGGTTQAFQFITCFIRLGTTYQGSVWRMTTAGAITIDTTVTVWVGTPLALNSSTVTGTLPNANTTATSANTANTIALRDANGNTATGVIFPTATKTANYTVTAADSVIFCDTSGGAFSLTLPAPASSTGKWFRVIDTKGTFGANNLTLVRNASEKIEGLTASKVLQTNWGFFNVTCDGTDWYVG